MLVLRRSLLSGAFALLALLIGSGSLPGSVALAAPIDGCNSAQITAAFGDFGRTGRLPPDISEWLSDARAQYVAPYKAFDNVYFVGICWVSSWIIRTGDGAVLIDTLHEPHVDQLIANIKATGVDLADIRFVLMTHGHFDHVGGAFKLKALLPHARFVMTQVGWEEAAQSARQSEGSPRPWKMIAPDMVAKDGDVIRLGEETFGVLETPGHTYGTASYTYDVREGNRTWHAITVGGQGLNAIRDSKQVEAYIASIERIDALAKRPNDPITVHLTTHPSSNRLTEAKDELANRVPPAPHPLVDPAGFERQLEGLRHDAEQRLTLERNAGR